MQDLIYYAILLTNKVLLEQLIFERLFQMIPTFCKTRNFIEMFAGV